MVQKIITAFRAMHKFNLSNERLQKWAEKQATKIENEEDIQAFLDEADVEHLIEIAKLDDALRVKAPKVEDPKPKDDEPNDEIESLKQQMAKMQEILENKSKSDLSATRLSELKDLPEALKATLKFVPLDSLSDDDYNALKTDLNAQAEALKLDNSKNNPFIGGQKPNAQMSEEKAKEIANKI